MRIDFNTEAKAQGYAADLRRFGDEATVTCEDGVWYVTSTDEDGTDEAAFERSMS